jgi:hypothetical protein
MPLRASLMAANSFAGRQRSTMKNIPFSPTLLSTYSSTCWMPMSTRRGLEVRQKEQIQVLVFLFFWE